MVLRYGMDAALGPVVLADRPSGLLPSPDGVTGDAATAPTSQATAQRIDDAVRGLLEEAQSRATGLLRQHRAVLDRCVQALLAKETLDEAELHTLAAPLSSASRQLAVA
jgi:cell division protease FtsH